MATNEPWWWPWLCFLPSPSSRLSDRSDASPAQKPNTHLLFRTHLDLTFWTIFLAPHKWQEREKERHEDSGESFGQRGNSRFSLKVRPSTSELTATTISRNVREEREAATGLGNHLGIVWVESRLVFFFSPSRTCATDLPFCLHLFLFRFHSSSESQGPDIPTPHVPWQL